MGTVSVDEEMIFDAIVGWRQREQRMEVERRRSWRRPMGALAKISRLIGSEEVNPLDVLMVNVSKEGVGMRSAVGFSVGGVYCLRIGSGLERPAQRVRIIYSRRREDEAYDVGGEFV